MYTYLKKDTKKKYIEFPEILDENYPQGSSYEDYLANMWIPLSEEQLAFRSENPDASPKEVINKALDPVPEPTPEELLWRAKSEKQKELDEYNFRQAFLDGVQAWTTNKLEVRDSCERNETVEFAGSIYPSDSVKLFIDKQSDYEDICADAYNTLKTSIDEADTVKAVEAIKITGFPEVINTTNEELGAEVKKKTESSVGYQAVMFSRMMVNTPTMAASVPSNDALKIKGLYPVWGEEGAKMGKKVFAGFRFNHNEDLYEVIQEHSLSAEWVPGVGTESLYKVVQEEHSGAIDDPIPWKYNMTLENGKYYTDKGVKYICTRDSINPMPYENLADLINGGFVAVVD